MLNISSVRRGFVTLANMFEKHFTLEEAVGLLPTVKQALCSAHQELDKLRDELILLKRVTLQKQKSGRKLLADEESAFEEKRMAFEATFKTWAERFIRRGIMVRDLERGLIDFPYLSADDEEFMLCWHEGEDGIFYFHEIGSGYSGRKPISLLPA